MAQQRDQQAADDQRVGEVVGVLGQGGRPLEPRASRAASRSRCSARCQTFHSSTLSPIRRRAAAASPTASTIAADRPDHPVEVRRARQVVVDGLVRRRVVVGVQGEVVDDVARRARGPSPPTSRRSASRIRSCRRRRARSTGRRGASRARPRPRDGRTRRRSCSRSATDRPSRCRGTTSGSPYGSAWPFAARRSAIARADRARCSTRRGRAPPRRRESRGSPRASAPTPASRAQATNSSVPTRFGSIERQARSCRSGRRSRGPTPSSQS